MAAVAALFWCCDGMMGGGTLRRIFLNTTPYCIAQQFSRGVLATPAFFPILSTAHPFGYIDRTTTQTCVLGPTVYNFKHQEPDLACVPTMYCMYCTLVALTALFIVCTHCFPPHAMSSAPGQGLSQVSALPWDPGPVSPMPPHQHLRDDESNKAVTFSVRFG